jgi:hypothetical protein
MEKTVINRQKKMIIGFLYLGTLTILFLGVFFSTYSILNNLTFQVLNAEVPGFVFGLLTAYLGLRYFFMVQDFKTGFYISTDRFSWSNFKRNKKRLAKQ